MALLTWRTLCRSCRFLEQQPQTACWLPCTGGGCAARRGGAPPSRRWRRLLTIPAVSAKGLAAGRHQPQLSGSRSHPAASRAKTLPGCRACRCVVSSLRVRQPDRRCSRLALPIAVGHCATATPQHAARLPTSGTTAKPSCCPLLVISWHARFAAQASHRHSSVGAPPWWATAGAGRCAVTFLLQQYAACWQAGAVDGNSARDRVAVGRVGSDNQSAGQK